MTEDLVRAMRGAGRPVSPATQMRMLLDFGRQRNWTFETAWRWSFERMRMPHDTAHRQEWRSVLGLTHDDPRREPCKQRAVWKSAYERGPQTRPEEGVGRLLVAV